MIRNSGRVNGRQPQQGFNIRAVEQPELPGGRPKNHGGLYYVKCNRFVRRGQPFKHAR